MTVTEDISPTILFVDDEPDLQVLLRQRFRRQIKKGELSFYFALNGAEAIEMLLANPEIDFVISDINMPVMNGLEFLTRLRSEFPLVRAVMLSAYGDMENIRSAMNRGAFDFLTKPIDFDDFDLTIKKTLTHVREIKKHLMSSRENSVMKDFVDQTWVTKILEEKPIQPIGSSTDNFQHKGETIDATILFADICGFTSMAECVSPEELVDSLNRFFDVMVEAIQCEGGIVDKFMGDAVMAIFQGEDRLERGFRAAVAINEKLRSLPQAKIEGENYAPKVSVGINDGKVVYGPIGAAAAHRLDFTVIGDTVNLAARVESIAEADQIVLRSDLADRLSSQYAFEQLGKRKIKGKDHPVELSSFVVT